MNTPADHMTEVVRRYRRALDSYLASPVLIAALTAELDEFFRRHPDLVRTPLAEQFIAALALERITNVALSPAESSTPTVRNAA